jgi:hypothetical protein
MVRKWSTVPISLSYTTPTPAVISTLADGSRRLAWQVTARRHTALFFAGQDGEEPRCHDGSCYVYSLGVRQVRLPPAPGPTPPGLVGVVAGASVDSMGLLPPQ